MNDLTAWKEKFKPFLAGALLYGLGLLLFNIVPYYQKTLSSDTQYILLFSYLAYLLLGGIWYLFLAKTHANKPLLVLKGFYRIITKHHLEKAEKNAILFMLVKLFFLPLMLNFFFENFSSLLAHKFSLDWYAYLLILLFTIDTFIFCLGYLLESGWLKNSVRSVEPTLIGWVVALICYPPFNSMVGSFVPWGANDQAFFWSDNWTMIIRVIIILLLIIYVWATVALGFKSSNLTNRGIVSKFPYSLVRHPAYISKNLMWWVTLIPVISWQFALGMLFWSTIYFFRALTEEKHLSQDPDYLEYKKKVKWKFIPRLY